MGKVTCGFSMSLDGFVAGPNDTSAVPLGEGGDRLFKWYFEGAQDDSIQIGNSELKMSRAGAEFVREASKGAGVLVTARRTFDIANAWGGRHPMNVPIVVLTHRVPQEWVKEGSVFTFVTDGVESAIAKAKQIAGDRDVVVGAPSVVQQCLEAGLMDEIHVDLVPCLLFYGVRLFDHLGIDPVDLELVEGSGGAGVLHLTYRVIKG